MKKHTPKSEAVSDNPGKRGRPPVMTEFDREIVKFCSPDIRTERGKQNTHYRQLALSVLGGRDNQLYNWLINVAEIASGKSAWKPGILSELGRITDPDIMREVAAAICVLKPKTKDAVVLIRRYRLKTAGKTIQLAASSHQVAGALQAALNGVLHQYPETTAAAIRYALQHIYDSIEEGL